MAFYDAIIISFDGNDGIRHNILIDGGDYDSVKYCYTDRLKIKLQEIFGKEENIDLWIISHIDNDHIGGLVNFVNDQDFFNANSSKLHCVWMNYGGKGDYHVHKDGEIGYNQGKELRGLLQESGIRLVSGVSVGLRLAIAGAVLTVIGPNKDCLNKFQTWWSKREFKDSVSTTTGHIAAKACDYDKAFADFDENSYDEDSSITNRSSIAVVLTYNENDYLFAADSCSSIIIEGLISQGFINEGKANLSLLHVPHHGSCRNTSKNLLDMVDCNTYVITGNGRNKYNLPNKETIGRLLKSNTEAFTIHFPNYSISIDSITKNEKTENLTLSIKNKYLFE